MDITKFLQEKIEESYKELEETPVSDWEKQDAIIKKLNMLVTKSIEAEKIESENEIKSEQFNRESDFKDRQLEENRKDKIWQIVLGAAGILIPSLLTVWGTCTSLRFEKEGTVTTAIGRGFINKLLPKK